jgi:hypothetical protein
MCGGALGAAPLLIISFVGYVGDSVTHHLRLLGTLR